MSEPEPPGMESLRRFHNWIKAVAIEKAVNSLPAQARNDVLDLACGRGGDLLKWERSHPRSYTGVDISEQVLEQARRRVDNLIKMRTEFHVGDMSSEGPWVRPGGFDVVSCMFGPHFAYKTRESSMRFLANVHRMLRPGGVFVCIFPCASEIEKFLNGRPRARSELFSIERCSNGVQFNVFGSTPDGVEPLLSSEQMRSDLTSVGFNRFLTDSTMRGVRASMASATQQRRIMRCPETLTAAQWQLADLHRVIVCARG